MRLSEVLRALGKAPNPAGNLANKLGRENQNKADDKKPSNNHRNSMLDDTMYDIYELRNSARSKKAAAVALAQTQTL
ncbi:hypothetical protein COOONC_01699 [Cooperia oncophora]